MVIDLLNTKDTGLVGQIGEVIARKYLWQKDIALSNPGRIARLLWLMNQPDVVNLYQEVKKDSSKLADLDGIQTWLFFEYLLAEGIGEERIRYIADLRWQGPNWCWDYVGHTPSCLGVYLIEVKTSRVGKKYGLKSGWSGRSRRGYGPEDLEKVKSLGFRLLLVNVRLLDNWQFEVSEEEL